MAEQDQEFVEYVVKALVDNPSKVKVERRVDEMGVLLELTVDPQDMGKVIGKEGKTAKSIRTLLRVLGAKNNARVNLKIIEPEGGRGAVRPLVEEETPPPKTEEKPPADKEETKPIEEQPTEVV